MPVAVVQIVLDRALSRERLQRIKKRIGQALLEQTLDRIEKGGDDEITFASLEHARPTGGQDHPLRGPEFMHSLSYGFDERGVWVGSNHISARVQLLGTVGAGGVLPTIRPVQADALFIPLTRRAAMSVLQFGVTFAERRRVSLKNRKGRKTALGLIPGQDFVFSQTSDIHPRPYLRISRKNREELVELFETVR